MGLGLHFKEDYSVVCFQAMASPCQLLIASDDLEIVTDIAKACITEVRRIEQKFSRYATHNLCHVINTSQGASIPIDDECYRLLLFAETCFELSDGLFDVTSGILRRAWTFNGSDKLPTHAQVAALLPLVGWQHVEFDDKHIRMKPHMELDFGGIGKEYAVSCVAKLCQQLAPQISVLINLGGDIQITQPRPNRKPWSVGIANHSEVIPIVEGALATSGDANRYLLKDGVRYSHILNPKTGWPVMGAPESITIFASLCVQAGCLATLALLQGAQAEHYLSTQDVQFWCSRS